MLNLWREFTVACIPHCSLTLYTSGQEVEPPCNASSEAVGEMVDRAMPSLDMSLLKIKNENKKCLRKNFFFLKYYIFFCTP